MPFCTNCGSEYTGAINFCGKCGKSMKEQINVDVEYNESAANEEDIIMRSFTEHDELSIIKDGNDFICVGFSEVNVDRIYCIRELIIPNGVTSIGDYAFSGEQLTSVVIPDSVTSIGKSAFARNQLASVVIPDSVTDIGVDAFSNNQLTSITLGNSVTSIGEWAFYNNLLTSIVIPDSVASIGEYVFANNQLTNVTIPDSVLSLGESAFSDNPLTNVDISKDVDHVEENTFGNREHAEQETIISNDVDGTEIADREADSVLQSKFQSVGKEFFDEQLDVRDNSPEDTDNRIGNTVNEDLARKLMSVLPHTQASSDRYWKIRDCFCLTKIYSGGWVDPDRDELIHEYLNRSLILDILRQVNDDHELDEREAIIWLEDILAKAESCREWLLDDPYFDEEPDSDDEELSEGEETEDIDEDEDDEAMDELTTLRSNLAEILLDYAFDPIWNAICHIHETALQALDVCSTPEERFQVLQNQWTAYYVLQETVINGTAEMFDEYIFDRGGYATFESEAAGIYPLMDDAYIRRIFNLIRETDFQVNETFWEKIPTLNLFRFWADELEMSAQQAVGIAEDLTAAIRQVSDDRLGACQSDETDGNLVMDVSLSICRFMLHQLEQIS